GRDDDSMMETLAENRAGAVRDWLVKNGVPPSVINVTADTSGADGSTPRFASTASRHRFR
ncbi:hypothetical protein, partial [Burkholderia vietnamiensis]|uniref:hypothetical protein n=1 Tax=Burkholderia vietnamiensis TaxID=60552 RepID=UPI001A954A5E